MLKQGKTTSEQNQKRATSLTDRVNVIIYTESQFRMGMIAFTQLGKINTGSTSFHIILVGVTAD